MLSLAIVTISDRVSRLIIKDIFSRTTAKLVCHDVIPDEKEVIIQHLKKLADQMRVGIVMTTGGTGFSVRDITPEATRAVIEREVPGFGEVMRVEGYRKTPLALLSRGIAGLRGQTLIINLPGSSKGVRESLEIILPVLEHGLGILKGKDLHDDYKQQI